MARSQLDGSLAADQAAGVELGSRLVFPDRAAWCNASVQPPLTTTLEKVNGARQALMATLPHSAACP